MNHRSVVIWGSLAVFVSVSALIVYMDTRKPPRPELTWDARFIESSNDYGVRFRTERNLHTSPAKLPPMAVRELSQEEADRQMGTSTRKRSAFEITGVTDDSGYNLIPGEPEPAVDCTKPIVFSDGSEARLKVIVGLDDGLGCNCGRRFAWAMTPEGKPLTKDEAKSLGWPGDGGGSWPVQPHSIQCVFELKGALRFRESGYLDVGTGHATRASVTYGASGNRQILAASSARWEPGAKELIFIAIHGPMKSVDLPATAESESDLDGIPMKHLGAFTVFTGWGSSQGWTTGNMQISFSGERRERLHFVQFPSGTSPAALRATDSGGGELYAKGTWRNLIAFTHSPDARADFIRISKFSGVRRIRLRLPELPASHVVTRIEDPLDRLVPVHWDKANIDVQTALRLLAELNAFYYSSRSSEPLDCKLSEFQGDTLREILAEALAAELRAGKVVEIDRANRTLAVKAPEPGAFQRLAKWLTETARRLGL